MSLLVQPARVLLDPLGALERAVQARQWVWPLLLLALCVSASGVAFSLRWNASSTVVGQAQARGQMEQMTESELAEEIEMASRRALVAGIAKGVALAPLLVLLLAAVLWLCGWLFEARAPFGKLLSAATLALLPIALYHLILTLCTLWQHSVSQGARLVPSSLAALDGLSLPLQRLLSGVDFFNLWSVGLLGLGFSAATGMRRGRAMLLAGALYLMFVGVFLVGLPGMQMGMMRGGGR